MAVSMQTKPRPFGCLSRRSRHHLRVSASSQQPMRQWKVAGAVNRVFAHTQAAAAQTVSVVLEQQTLAQQLKQQCSGMAAILPFASTTIVRASSTTQAEIYYGLAKAVDIYLAILTVRVLLSWFRNIDWLKEPWNTLRQLTDPFLQVFRGIIPPLGGIDLSPMLGFFLLNFLRGFLMNFAM
eukprot:GHUV01003157.1.p1 GENE.GHUV01003157.1~~GHUV01003157.1.p1  ORF type:complete len:181 (+),score=49.98 GHUV01003157.1:200-742(+)